MFLGEIMSFLGTDKISLKKLNTWLFIHSLEQVYSRPAEMILSFFPVCPGNTSEQAQFNPEWIQIFSCFKIKILKNNQKTSLWEKIFF